MKARGKRIKISITSKQLHLPSGSNIAFGFDISQISSRNLPKVTSSAQFCIMVRTHEQVAQWQNALAPHIVERLARETPDNKYGEWVSKDSVVVITYAQLANVIDGLAWLIVEQLGGPGRYGANPEVLAYVGTSDVRYSALVLAAAKAGYTVRMIHLLFSTLFFASILC